VEEDYVLVCTGHDDDGSRWTAWGRHNESTMLKVARVLNAVQVYLDVGSRTTATATSIQYFHYVHSKHSEVFIMKAKMTQVPMGCVPIGCVVFLQALECPK
jgi:hypothetical protein